MESIDTEKKREDALCMDERRNVNVIHFVTLHAIEKNCFYPFLPFSFIENVLRFLYCYSVAYFCLAPSYHTDLTLTGRIIVLVVECTRTVSPPLGVVPYMLSSRECKRRGT